MPLTQRQIFRRRRVVFFGATAVVLSTLFYLPLTLLAPLSVAAVEVSPYAAPKEDAASLAWPNYGASAIGAVGFPGVLASSGSSDPLPIASISKLVTALVVLNAKPLAVGEAGPNITFGSKDVQFFNSYLAQNGKVEPVHSGMVLSEHDVLEVTLVASANNYAASLARWAFGSEPAFVQATTAWLSAHNLSETTLVEPTGISPLNKSTAADLLELGKIALAEPIVSTLVQVKTVTVPSVGEIKNTNNLLGKHGVLGIKTGTLGEAGSCLLFAAEYAIGTKTVTVVGVILGGVDHASLNKDVVALLAGVKKSFHQVTLVKKGEVFATFSTAWNSTAQAIAAKSSSVVVWADTPVALQVDTEKVTLANRGDNVGTLKFTVGTALITVPLTLAKTLADPGPLWRLGHPGELF
jgi:serine-type D-Ala-D-Ala carboxypeptidase (penicillin-binding protein 5/6)